MARGSTVCLGRPVQDAHLNGTRDSTGRLRPSPEPVTRRLDLGLPRWDAPTPLVRLLQLQLRSRAVTTAPHDPTEHLRLESPAYLEGR